MQAISGLIIGLIGFLGLVGSQISLKYSWIVIVIMSVLKLTGTINILWFSGPLTAGAISTGLWMILGGLILMGVSFVVTFAGAYLMQNA